MREFIENLKVFLQERNIPWDRQTVVLLAVLVGAAFLLLFLVLRWLWDRTAALSARAPAEPSLIVPPPPRGWRARFDRSFALMVQRTSLELSPGQAVGWIALGAMLGAALFFLPRQEPWHALLGAVLGGVAVLAALLAFAARHRRKVQEQLPDALFMLARSVRAHQSLEKAIELVGRQGGDAVAPEFRRCAAQIGLGLPILTALQNLAGRLQLLDVYALVSAVSMHQTTGGNLPQLLDRLAISARDRNHFYGYVRSATALGRLSAFALAIATPAIVLVYFLFQPEFARGMLQSRTGLTLIAVALALEVIGAVWLYRLQKIEP